MSLRIGVVSNLQTPGLMAAFAALLPSAEVFGATLFSLTDAPEAQQALAERMHVADLAVIGNAGPSHFPFMRRTMQSHARCCVYLPPIEFSGFHPDTLQLKSGANFLMGPTAAYQSRLAIGAFLAGLEAEEAASLFNKLIFARLGYLDVYEKQLAAVAALAEKRGWAADPLVAELRAAGCFMHAPYHPRPAALLAFARAVCAANAIDIENPEADAAGLNDDLADQPAHPFHADLATPLGLSGSGAYRGPGVAGGPPRVLSLEQFLQQSFAVFEGASEAVLRATPGLESVFAAIGQSSRPAPAAPRSCVLMTWHGTLLRRAVDGAWVGQGLADPSVGEDIVLPVPVGPRFAAVKLDAVDGAELLPAGEPGLVRLRRNDRWLCAEAGRAEIGFNRFDPFEWETFLPLAEPMVARLRDLAGNAWRDGATGQLIARSLIRMLPGFTLQCGPYQASLRRGVVLRPVDDGALELRHGGGSVVLTREASLEAPAVASIAARAAAGPLALGQVASILGASEHRHAPLTAAAVDRVWLTEAVTPFLTPGCQLRPSMTLVRGAASMWRLGEAETDAVALPARPFVLASNGPAAPELADRGLEAALRLHVLAPFREPDAALLLTEGDGIDSAMLTALGLSAATETASGAAWRADDVLRLEDGAIARLPAAALGDFRARALHFNPPVGAKLTLLLTPTGAGALDNVKALQAALRHAGVTEIDPGTLSAAERVAVFARAGAVIGATGPALANILFCPAGTKVVELAPRDGFNPTAWIVAEKLGLHHAVIPTDGAAPDPARVKAMLRMLTSYG